MALIKIFGERQLAKRFGKMADNSRDYTNFWQANAKPILIEEIQYIFSKRGVPRWLRRKKPAAHPLMEKTGTLRRSWTIPRRKGNIFRIRKDHVEFGTSLPYAAAHEFGSPPRGLPARPILATLLKTKRGSRRSLARQVGEALETYVTDEKGRR